MLADRVQQASATANHTFQSYTRMSCTYMHIYVYAHIHKLIANYTAGFQTPELLPYLFGNLSIAGASSLRGRRVVRGAFPGAEANTFLGSGAETYRGPKGHMAVSLSWGSLW